MKQPKENSFEERRKVADEAKKRLLQRFKAAAPKPDDPEMQAKLAERQALAEARDARRAERDRLKKETQARTKAEAEARRQAEAEKRAETVVATEAERKAERDRRYAARKARQKR